MNRESNPFQARMQFARAPQSLAGRVITFILSAVFLVLAFMFSLVALAVVAVGALIFAGWFWWKTRALRKAMREGAPIEPTAPGADQVIEGEFVRETPENRLLR